MDCISTAHPSLLTKEEINDVGVPAQILAPEHDPVFVPEMRTYANETIPKLNVAYDYQFFPGVVHGFAIKCGDEGSELDRKSLYVFFRVFPFPCGLLSSGSCSSSKWRAQAPKHCRSSADNTLIW